MKTISVVLSQKSHEDMEDLIDKLKDLNHIELMKKAHRYVKKWKKDRQRYLRFKRMVYDLVNAIYRPETGMVTLVMTAYEEGEFPRKVGIDFITIPMKILKDV